MIQSLVFNYLADHYVQLPIRILFLSWLYLYHDELKKLKNWQISVAILSYCFFKYTLIQGADKNLDNA